MRDARCCRGPCRRAPSESSALGARHPARRTGEIRCARTPALHGTHRRPTSSVRVVVSRANATTSTVRVPEIITDTDARLRWAVFEKVIMSTREVLLARMPWPPDSQPTEIAVGTTGYAVPVVIHWTVTALKEWSTQSGMAGSRRAHELPSVVSELSFGSMDSLPQKIQ